MHVLAYLRELQDKYVLVLADKAGNTIIVICKYFYICSQIYELRMNCSSFLNSAYVKQDVMVDDFIRTHAKILENQFDIVLQQKEKQLPQMY